MFVYVNIDYHSDAEWDKVDWAIVRENWPENLREEKPKDYWALRTADSVRVTLGEANALSSSGLKMNLIAPPGAQLTKMRDRSSWEPNARILPEHLHSGAAVQISVADVGLMLIDEVTWEDDCCTEKLQEKLDDGWRILAVCPPCAQRRPDYILGRRKRG